MLEINIPEVVAEVTETFMAYERALIANDVAALDSFSGTARSRCATELAKTSMATRRSRRFGLAGR